MHRPSTPPDPGKVLEAALDVFVYAPIGFVFDAREVVPKLVERGRNQVALARLFGKYALMRGQSEAERILNAKRAADSATATPTRRRTERNRCAARRGIAHRSSGVPAARTAATADRARRHRAGRLARRAPPSPQRAATGARATAPARADRPTTTSAAAKALPIPGYDSLSASQVVPRLDALRKRELEAVRVYEAAHRGRRTILNRIAQLQG